MSTLQHTYIIQSIIPVHMTFLRTPYLSYRPRFSVSFIRRRAPVTCTQQSSEVASFPGPARSSLAVREFRTASDERAGPGNEASSGDHKQITESGFWRFWCVIIANLLRVPVALYPPSCMMLCEHTYTHFQTFDKCTFESRKHLSDIFQNFANDHPVVCYTLVT